MGDVRTASVATTTADGWIEYSGSPTAKDDTNTYLSVYVSSSSESIMHRTYGFFDLRSIPKNAIVLMQPTLLINVLSTSVPANANQSIYIGGGGVLGDTLDTGDWGGVQAVAYETLSGQYFNSTGDKSFNVKPSTIRTGLGTFLYVEIRALPELGTQTIQLQAQEHANSTPMRIDFRYYVPDESYGLYRGTDIPVI